MRHHWSFMTGQTPYPGDPVGQLTVVSVCRVCGRVRSIATRIDEDSVIDVTGECEDPVRARYEQQ